MELIKIQENDKGQKVVSARELHEFLENKDNVNTWFKRQSERAMLIEEKDFVAILQESSGGRPSQDYALTLSSAKEIAMLNGGEKGKQARLYFIDCEEQLLNQQKPMNQLEMISFMALQMNEQNKRTEQLEKKVLEIESKQTTIDTNFYTISGYANLHKLKVDTQEANKLGRVASKTSRELQYPTGNAHDSKYGKVKTYHKDILKLTFKN